MWSEIIHLINWLIFCRNPWIYFLRFQIFSKWGNLNLKFEALLYQNLYATYNLFEDRFNMRSTDNGQVTRKIVWGRLSNCWKFRGHLTGLNFWFEDKINMRSKENFLRLVWSLDKLRTIFEVGFRTMEMLEATGLASKFSIWGQVKYEVQRQFF